MAKVEKVVVCYESKSHGKKRFFVAGPDVNPLKDGKPQWTYEKKEARVFGLDEKLIVASVMHLCSAYGYHGLTFEPAGPTLTVVGGTDMSGFTPDADEVAELELEDEDVEDDDDSQDAGDDEDEDESIH